MPNQKKLVKASSFPTLTRSRTSTRRIVSNPYDSDSDISFVQPYADKKCRVKRPTLLESFVSNAADLHDYGQRLAIHANHVIQTLAASDSDESELSDSEDNRRRRRARRSVKVILDQAGQCAASLKNVADELPEVISANPCLGMVRDGDNSSSSPEMKTSRVLNRKAKVSEARPHDGTLSEEISVTTDASSSDYSSGGDSSSASSFSSVAVTRLAKRSRRRKQFLRRRAMERAAAAETEDEAVEADEEHASLHFGRPRFVMKKRWDLPSQELRRDQGDVFDIQTLSGASQAESAGSAKSPPTPLKLHKEGLFDANEDESSKCSTLADVQTSNAGESVVPGRVDTSKDDSLLDTTIEDESPNMVAVAKGREQLAKWQSIRKSFHIGSLDPKRCSNFLETSHQGPRIFSLPSESMRKAGMQMGDVIIRFNGVNVSNLDANSLFDKICGVSGSQSGAGERVSITFLRKVMLL